MKKSNAILRSALFSAMAIGSTHALAAPFDVYIDANGPVSMWYGGVTVPAPGIGISGSFTFETNTALYQGNSHASAYLNPIVGASIALEYTGAPAQVFNANIPTINTVPRRNTSVFAIGVNANYAYSGSYDGRPNVVAVTRTTNSVLIADDLPGTISSQGGVVETVTNDTLVVALGGILTQPGQFSPTLTLEQGVFSLSAVQWMVSSKANSEFWGDSSLGSLQSSYDPADVEFSRLALIFVNQANSSDTFYLLTEGVSWSNEAPSEVPVPATAWLFGTGLAGLVAIRRRK